MIDAENLIFSKIAAVLRAAYSGIFVTGENVAAPSSFPAVSIVEADNSLYARTKDLAGNENHSVLMYEINCYSNLSSGKKAQCKSIMALVDTEMQKLGFVRVGRSPMELPNADVSKYRMNARYRGVISKTGAIHKIT